MTNEEKLAKFSPHMQKCLTNLLAHSVTEDPFEVMNEWRYIGKYHDELGETTDCDFCDYPDILHRYQIKNTLNDKVLEIGSECIKKFLVEGFDADLYLYELESGDQVKGDNYKRMATRIRKKKEREAEEAERERLKALREANEREARLKVQAAVFKALGRSVFSNSILNQIQSRRHLSNKQILPFQKGWHRLTDNEKELLQAKIYKKEYNTDGLRQYQIDFLNNF